MLCHLVDQAEVITPQLPRPLPSSPLLVRSEGKPCLYLVYFSFFQKYLKMFIKKFFFNFNIGASLLHHALLVSVVQHESPPSCATIPLLPTLCSSLPPVSYFTHGSIYISGTFPIRPLSHSPPVVCMSILTEHQISYIVTHI